MMRCVPRWILWSAGIPILWLVWFLAVRNPMVRTTAALDGQCTEIEKRVMMFNARVAAVPRMLGAIDSSRFWLDSALAEYTPTDTIDQLIDQLHETARKNRLYDVRIDPDLPSVLAIPPPMRLNPNLVLVLDTLDVTITAEGRFAGVGAFLDALEARQDFRGWGGCRWSSGTEDGLVALEAHASFLVVSRQWVTDRDNMEMASTDD